VAFSDVDNCSMMGFIAGQRVNVAIAASLDKKNSPKADL
jgi:hypothetical protein